MKDRRVVFPSGEQRQFLFNVRKTTHLSWENLSKIAGVSIRTLTDWKRGKYTLPLSVYKQYIRISRLHAPQNIQIRKSVWWVQEAARLGGLATYKKYGMIGDPKKRRLKWLEWWQKAGRFSHKDFFIVKSIAKPRKNGKLAEFVGIMMGDGGITKKQISVTVHYRDDRQYSLFIVDLMRQLFDIVPSKIIWHKRHVITITISRVLLVQFCQSIGLVVGDKIRQQIDVPAWINTHKTFRKAFIRGLMDTDGCAFIERHKLNGRVYCYPRLSLVSASAPLRRSVYKMLQEMDFSPKIRNNRSVQLEHRDDIIRYFRTIGSHNPKHRKRWQDM